MPHSLTTVRFWSVLACVPLVGALGGYLVLRPFLSPWLFLSLAAVGLLVAAYLSATRVVAQQPIYLLSTGWVFLGSYAVTLWLFPLYATRLAVTVMVVALIFNGVARLFPALRKPFDQPLGGFAGRTGAILLGITSFFFAALILVWPLLFVGMLELIFGLWFIFQGIRAALFLSRSRTPGTAAPVRGYASPRGAIVWGTVGLLSGGALIVVTNILLSGDTHTTPDAFYTVAGPLPTEPGELISYGPLQDRPGDPEDPANAGLAPGQVGWRILYSTTSASGNIEAASATVVVSSAHLTSTLPVLAISHGTTGILPSCAPSLAPKPLDGGAMAATEAMIDQGWAAVTTDYVGLGTSGPHPYLVGPAAAHNVLDSVLAAQKLPDLKLEDDTVLWGHSQGGHGALWSAGLAPEYAPSLNVLGVAAMAPATNLFDLANNVKDSAAGKIVSAYIAGSWEQVYPELNIPGLLERDYLDSVREVSANCFSGLDSLASIVRTSQMSGPIFVEEAFDPLGPLATRLRENSVSVETVGLIEVPVLIAQGEGDSLVLPSMQDRWVESMCAAGQELEYRTYPGLDHMPLVSADSPLTGQVVNWTLDRLTDGPVGAPCVFETRTVED